jgi:hypothetical protein
VYFESAAVLLELPGRGGERERLPACELGVGDSLERLRLDRLTQPPFRLDPVAFAFRLELLALPPPELLAVLLKQSLFGGAHLSALLVVSPRRSWSTASAGTRNCPVGPTRKASNSRQRSFGAP